MRHVFDATPRPLYSRESPTTHCIGGWADPWPVWKTRKISSPPGFGPRIVQLVASRYTVWAISAPKDCNNRKEIGWESVYTVRALHDVILSRTVWTLQWLIYKHQLLPRIERFLVYGAFKSIHDRTLHRNPQNTGEFEGPYSAPSSTLKL